MYRCLAFDSSTEDCSVALVLNHCVRSLKSSEPRSHSQKLLPFADSLLKERNHSIAQLDFIACSVGPGSFTGLRIAFGVAQGLAFAAELPLIGVSSLDALALAGATQVQDEAELVFSVLDARMGELYWAAHNIQAGSTVSLIEPQLHSVGDAIERMRMLVQELNVKNIAIVGPGAALLSQLTSWADKVIIDEALTPNAEAVARLAAAVWQSGSYPSIETVELAYLRNSISWNKRKRIREISADDGIE